jgi:hypothetical protein
MTNAPIEAAATATPSAPATPAAPAAPETAPAAAETPKMESGGMVDNDKIQWVAIGIFSLTMIALVYKAVFYRKSIILLGTENKNTDKKLKELETNVRALRKDKYETLS